jgi:hypothetical protein
VERIKDESQKSFSDTIQQVEVIQDDQRRDGRSNFNLIRI